MDHDGDKTSKTKTTQFQTEKNAERLAIRPTQMYKKRYT